jgi:hypothetical protein
MSGYRAAARGEIRKQRFRALFVRCDMVALVAILLASTSTGALVMPPKTDVHCLQLSRTCTFDRVYLGVAPFHDLLDLQGAVGPARVAGAGKHRYVAVQLEGGRERALGHFGPERDLVVEALTAFCLTRRDTDASHDGTLPCASTRKFYRSRSITPRFTPSLRSSITSSTRGPSGVTPRCFARRRIPVRRSAMRRCTKDDASEGASTGDRRGPRASSKFRSRSSARRVLCSGAAKRISTREDRSAPVGRARKGHPAALHTLLLARQEMAYAVAWRIRHQAIQLVLRSRRRRTCSSPSVPSSGLKEKLPPRYLPLEWGAKWGGSAQTGNEMTKALRSTSRKAFFSAVQL